MAICDTPSMPSSGSISGTGLHTALRELRSTVLSAHFAGKRSLKRGLRRIEVRTVSRDTGMPLQWLRRQQLAPQCYFAPPLPGRGVMVAGIGACDVIQGIGQASERLFARASHLPNGASFIGGARFSQNTMPDREWHYFGGHSFVLPLISVEHDCGELVAACNLAGDGAVLEMSRLTAIVVLDALLTREHEVIEAPLTSKFYPEVKHGTAAWLSLQRKSWSAIVAAALAQIDSKNLDKVVIARRRVFLFDQMPPALDVLHVLQAQNQTNELCYHFSLQLEGKGAAFFGCSPEALFALKDNGSIVVDSIAGTRGRGKSLEADDILAAELLLSRKDTLENALVASFVVTKLRRLVLRGILRFGVTINAISVLKLPFVMHLKCTLGARLTPFCPPWLALKKLLHALHPTPAVLGLPPKTAARFLEVNEDFDRGFYAGPFGVFQRQSAIFSVAIRSSLVLPENNTMFAYAGAGIVSGSDADAEWQETEVKLKPMDMALFDAWAQAVTPLPAQAGQDLRRDLT